MTTSTSNSTSLAGQDAGFPDDDATQRPDEAAPREGAMSFSGKAGRTVAVRPAAIGRLADNRATTAASPERADGASVDVLPGATVAEFTALNKDFDTRDGYVHESGSGNAEIARRMENALPREMTGYPPEVIRFEQAQLGVQGMLAELPLSEREFYGSTLATLSAAWQLETDAGRRFAIQQKFDGLEHAVRTGHNRAINDPVDRVLGVFSPPMGEGYLGKGDRERLDDLEQLREDFFDAGDSTERQAIFAEASELKALMQEKVNLALTQHEREQQTEWHEANGEVDRILKEAEAQTDPAKRYELPGRQLFQLDPGHDRLKDKVVLAFTQRMRDSEALRNKLDAWHGQVSGPLNAHSVGGPLKYTDILKQPPPVGADYLRDLSDQYTDVLRDASHKNYSITPKARAEKLATQILDGVMRVMAATSPVGFLADLVPSTLPDHVRTGLEVGGSILDVLTGVGVGNAIGHVAKAMAASARKAELDNLAGAGIRGAAKGLVDDAGERIVKEAAAEQALSPDAKLALQALEKKMLAEAGPAVDPVSQIAHEAVGARPYGSLSTYADQGVSVASLRPGSQPGVLEREGERYTP